jgi:hypothetical protein
MWVEVVEEVAANDKRFLFVDRLRSLCLNAHRQTREYDMDISIETITPRTAETMLKANTGNRPLTKAIVERYANDIKNGNWANDGSPIRFARCGRLLDGQHRLNAVISAGVAIDAVVMRGLNDDAFKTMDTGKVRGGADILGIAGYKNFAVASSIASGWIYYTRFGHPGNKGGAEKARNAEILAVYEANPEIGEASSFYAGNPWIRQHLTTAMMGVLYVAACKRGEREVMLRFFRELISPTAYAIGTAIMPLRDRLIEDKGSRDKMTKSMQGAYLFKAYRAYREGRPIKHLKVVLTNGRLTKEHFAL